MNFEIVYSNNFERELKKLIKKYTSLKKDLLVLIHSLEINSVQGTLIANQCYKIRLAISSKNKGKSGGARVITHIDIERKLIYLLSIYDKSEKSDISDKELMSLLELIKS